MVWVSVAWIAYEMYFKVGHTWLYHMPVLCLRQLLIPYQPAAVAHSVSMTC